MPTTLSETATYDTPITVPAPGDPRTAASVDAAFQALADRTFFLGATSNGFLLGAQDVSSLNGTDLLIDNIWMARFLASGVPAGAGNDAGVVTFTPPGLTANAWFYLYSYLSAGAIAYEASSTPPDPNDRLWKTGDHTRRYLCPLRTDGSSHILPFRATGAPGSRRVTYRRSVSSPTAPLANGIATSWTNVSLAGLVPPTARIAIVEMYLTSLILFSSSSPVLAQGFVRTNGDTGGSYFLSAPWAQVAATAGAAKLLLDVETDSSQVIQYQVSGSFVGGSPSNDGLTLSVFGFIE